MRQSLILDAGGRPFQVNGSSGSQAAVEARAGGVDITSKSILGAAMGDSYTSALRATRLPATLRAAQPLTSHPWIFAASFLAMLVGSQASYTVYRETDAELARRNVALGRTRVPRSGIRRRSAQRWIQRSVDARAQRTKALEPDYDHPLTSLLLSPCPLLSGQQLMQVTLLWMMLRSECGWLLTDDDGTPSGTSFAAGELPQRIYPIGPDCYSPRYENANGGELVGWTIRMPRWLPGYQPGRRIRVDVDDMVHFKLPDPVDLTRGLSRLAPLAGSIELDLMAKASLRALLENGSIPASVLENPNAPLSQEQEQALRSKWEEMHKGADNRGRMAILHGGLRLLKLAMTPAELGLQEQPTTNRDEILATLGPTPQSLVGLVDLVNYASSKTAELSYWEKAILPMLKSIELTIDQTLLAPETDQTVGMFDLSQVSALRAGIETAMQTARGLCGQELHMAPRIAFDKVGIEVEDYPGIDVCFVDPFQVSVKDVLSGSVPAAPAPAPVADDQASPDAAARAPLIRTAKSKASERAKRHAAFLRLQTSAEGAMRGRYRRWVLAEKARTLEAFDAIGREKGRATGVLRAGDVDLTVVLPIGDESKQRLLDAIRALQVDNLDRIFNFTAPEIGVPTFGIDDQAFIEFFRTHEAHIGGAASSTIRANLAMTLEAGIRGGETLSQLRMRVAEVYDLSSSSSRTLLTARTTTASFMSGVRDQMFRLQGFTKKRWNTAGDENVRAAHETFGKSGAQERGFNFMDLVGGGGVLEYPGDPRAPFGQIANCRCIELTEE